MTALLVIDIQNDFLPGGSLAIKKGDEVIPIIQELLNKNFDLIVATKDWHPKDHGSFAVTHQKRVGEIIDLEGLPQILWPVHCVQGTYGAEFAKGWDSHKIHHIFHKGTEKNIDSYSTFFDNGHRKSTGLGDFLKEKNVKKVFIAGLATDYCVKFSTLDAINLGFTTFVIEDACRGVNLQEGDSERAIEEMKTAGAQLIHSSEVDKIRGGGI